jgi:hypothetical protein
VKEAMRTSRDTGAILADGGKKLRDLLFKKWNM